MKTIFLRLREPSSLLLIAANALPIVGILFWHWDAFLLLLLYWMETAILGFWVMVAVAISPARSVNIFGQDLSRIGMIAFLLLHSGIFMGVHFMMLWELLAGGWASRIHGVVDFLKLVVIGQGLWLPLLVLFLARGFVQLIAERRQPLVLSDNEGSLLRSGPLFGFYLRIVIMQLTLILGGVIAVFAGAGVSLITLVVIKTAIDLKLFLDTDPAIATRDAKKPIA